jgi:putative transposase
MSQLIQEGKTRYTHYSIAYHLNVFVSAPPRFSPANLANLLKGYTSKCLRQKFPKLKKICGKDALWTSAYYVGTAGNVSAEVIRRYITECQGK